MLWKDIVSIHEISLQLRVLNIEYVCIELFELLIGHLVGMQLKPVPQHDFQFLGTDMAAPVHDLLAISVNFSWFLAVLMAVLTEDLGDVLAWVVDVGACLGVGVVVPFGHLCVAEIDLDLGAG